MNQEATFQLDTTPATALVDFNMTDSRGVVAALRRYLFGLVPTDLGVGQRMTAEDADGNTSDAIIFAVRDDFVELFLLPSPGSVEWQSEDPYLAESLQTPGMAFEASSSVGDPNDQSGLPEPDR